MDTQTFDMPNDRRTVVGDVPAHLAGSEAVTDVPVTRTSANARPIADVTPRPPGALGPGAASTEAMLAAALATEALVDGALSQTTSRGVRRATDRTKDLATIGDVRNAATLVARHLLSTMRVTSNALGDGVASLGQMLEDEAKAAKAREGDVDDVLGSLEVRLDDRVLDLRGQIAALARDVGALRDEFRRFEAVNLAAHNAAQRRIARLERSSWARAVAFVVRWWGVARGRFGATGTP